MKKWEMVPQIFTGEDCLSRLEQFENERVCLVCDPFLIGSENLQKVLVHLEKKNEVTTYSEIVPDPPIEIVAEGVARMRDHQPTVLVTVGGGSAIDTAKAMLFTMLVSGYDKVKRFVAIPTTSGTGSEVTSASVVTDNKEKIKYPVFDRRLIPDEALLDAQLVVSSPPTVTAYSGLDVLTHALEALVAKNRTTYTDALSEKAVRYVLTYLEACYNNGNNLNARKKMHEASCLAGLAFDAAGLGINHAIAHQVGGQFKVPHGLANAMLLPHVVNFNAKDPEARRTYAKIAVQMGLGNSSLSEQLLVTKLIKAITKLCKKVDCPMSLQEFGVERKVAMERAQIIAQNALKDSTYPFNPIAANESELISVYTKIV
ncbi:iron-containing alcohol dehydrogenase [Enterococcus sp. 669A]|uniref:Iron-containing alcohol dehydrogenase n=1 Tax=Candidatus Enterococcus moelleringii TaxID=2815325 RepID=A0ABS3LH41_9ENTE|nr:1-propanol dehydrogenase PduQ [Enterococcus sp. 669A]MBO1308415.1 iron-containing alcohol dehydrogenase [Enterococcus sp. 669A]